MVVGEVGGGQAVMMGAGGERGPGEEIKRLRAITTAAVTQKIFRNGARRGWVGDGGAMWCGWGVVVAVVEVRAFGRNKLYRAAEGCLRRCFRGGGEEGRGTYILFVYILLLYL